jgi:hypothetical protein
VVAVKNEDAFLIALPYGEQTDWLRNVLASGSATLVTAGEAYELDSPEIIPMADATRFSVRRSSACIGGSTSGQLFSSRRAQMLKRSSSW